MNKIIYDRLSRVSTALMNAKQGLLTKTNIKGVSYE